jgi:hypothetical protein
MTFFYIFISVCGALIMFIGIIVGFIFGVQYFTRK